MGTTHVHCSYIFVLFLFFINIFVGLYIFYIGNIHSFESTLNRVRSYDATTFRNILLVCRFHRRAGRRFELFFGLG